MIFDQEYTSWTGFNKSKQKPAFSSKKNDATSEKNSKIMKQMKKRGSLQTTSTEHT